MLNHIEHPCWVEAWMDPVQAEAADFVRCDPKQMAIERLTMPRCEHDLETELKPRAELKPEV
jgi:hypothetical protein